jgi:hypothetical protein
MAIVDSFSFSEPYEINNLLVKLHTEDAGVDEWVITENTFSFRGDYKGPHQLRTILESDTRFKPFLPKIKIFEVDIQRKCPDGVEDLTILFTQRETQRQYIEQKYDPTDWILVSDVDEIIDFENPEKGAVVLQALAEHPGELVHPNPLFFIYDYDNLVVGNEWFNLAFAQLKWFQKKNYQLEKARIYHREGYVMTPGIAGYHYHSVCSRQGLWRKLQTYGHTNFIKEDVNKCLFYNHGLYRSKLGENFNTAQFNIAQVELTPTNSPKYVRDNIESIKTHTIHPEYTQNRKDYLNGIYTEIPDLVGVTNG